MIAICCELQRNTSESEATFIKVWSVSVSQREHSNNTKASVYLYVESLACS